MECTQPLRSACAKPLLAKTLLHNSFDPQDPRFPLPWPGRGFKVRREKEGHQPATAGDAWIPDQPQQPLRQKIKPTGPSLARNSEKHLPASLLTTVPAPLTESSSCAKNSTQLSDTFFSSHRNSSK